MKLKIIDQKEMPLLERKVINLELESHGTATPKKSEVVKELVSLLKTKESLLKVKRIHPHYGGDKADVKVHLYSNEEALKTFEKVKKVKDKSKEKAK